MKSRLIAIGMAVALTACQPANQAGTTSKSAPGLEVQRIAQVTVSAGTSKVMGTVRLPASLLGQSGTKLDALTFVPSAKLSVVDKSGQPIANTEPVTAEAGGVFSFPSVPLGVSMILRAEVTVGGQTLVLKKLLRPSDALTCAHVDLATTAITDKILSTHPLVLSDPGLQGADLFELFMPPRLLDVESQLRKRLEQAPPPGVEEVRSELAAGDTSPVFDQLVAGSSELPTAYHGVFERPDSSLGIHIAAVGTNSIGVADRTRVSGILRLKVVNIPDDVGHVEVWAKSDQQVKVAESSTGPTFEMTFDTWTLANGDYTLDTISSTGGRNPKKRLLGQTFITIDNSVNSLCPLP